MDFIRDVLLGLTTEPIYVLSLSNIRGAGLPERHILTRDPVEIESFVTRWNVPGRGTFFCVSSIQEGRRRLKQFARELPMLFVDVDFKLLQIEHADQVLHALLALRHPPSLVIFTGGGYHCYWFLNRPFDGEEAADAERLLRLLADQCGADRSVCQVVAVLRMPGSFNTKRSDNRADWVHVHAVHEGGQVYRASDLDAWLSSLTPPALKRKPREGVDESTNPFLRAAEAQGLRPVTDLDAVLRCLADGTEVHNNQRTATASMLMRGFDREEIIYKVLDATKASCPASWNWEREEKKIRGMVKSFEEKFAETLAGRREIGERQAAVSISGDNVVSLSQVREDKKPKSLGDAKITKAPMDAHVALGKGFLLVLSERKEKILFVSGRLWRYRAGVWTGLLPEEEKNWLAMETEIGCRAIGFTPTTKVINETRAWLQRNPETYLGEDPPWDMHGKIATKSGLVDPQTLTVETLEPKHYATNTIDCEFDPSADCPTWKQMMEDYFLDDPGAIEFLQEILGAALLKAKPRTLTRALVLLGPSNSGKSNILRVLGGLVSAYENTTPLEMLENAHGLTNFLKPHPWILHEAFEYTRWELSSTVKALLSGDPVTVNVKNSALISHTYSSPAFWGTNVPPQFKEASRAIENRLAILPIHRVFDPRHLIGVAKEAEERGYPSPAALVLAEEKSGLLNWALAGLKRVRARGRYNFTPAMEDALKVMRLDGNLVAGFMAECVEFCPDTMVSTNDYNVAFKAWWEENKGDGSRTPSPSSIGRAITALSDHRLAHSKEDLRFNQKRYIAGIKLNDTGKDYFHSGRMVADNPTRISAAPSEVNAAIPPEWLERSAIVHMRTVQARNSREQE